MLKLKNQSIWVAFQYERVPKFYFSCGVICHGEGGCQKGNGNGKIGDSAEQEFGPWLQVPPNRPWQRWSRMKDEQDGYGWGVAGDRGGYRLTRAVHTTNNSRKSRRYATSKNGWTYFNTSHASPAYR